MRNPENALTVAASKGDVVSVKQLISTIDPKTDESEALSVAAKNGHLAIVQLLIPLSQPELNGSQALRWAVSSGNEKVVQALIPVSNPKDIASAPLRSAVERRLMEMVHLLLPVSDVDKAFEHMMLGERNPDIIDTLSPFVAIETLQFFGHEKLLLMPQATARLISQHLEQTLQSKPVPSARPRV